MRIILSIDPGKWVLPWCIWDDNELVRCGLSQLEKHPRPKPENIAHYHASYIPEWVFDRVYIEQLSLNSGRDNSRGKAIATGNDLLMLTSVAALVAGHLNAPVTYLPVNTWKGSAPKLVTQNRVKATLTARELEVFALGLTGVKKSLHHNLYDAAGIGLYAVGRYRPGKKAVNG